MDLEILKIASNTDNNKVLNNHTHFSKLKNPICGDEMHVGIKIVKDTLANFIKGYKDKENILFDTVIIWPNYEQSNWYVLMSYESCFVRWIEIQPDNINSIIEYGKNL